MMHSVQALVDQEIMSCNGPTNPILGADQRRNEKDVSRNGSRDKPDTHWTPSMAFSENGMAPDVAYSMIRNHLSADAIPSRKYVLLEVPGNSKDIWQLTCR